MRNDLPIGVFDSGLGGMTVLREIHRELPAESTIYLGDTARVPYGIRSDETVRKYCAESVAFLKSRGIKLLVVACNTASSIALESIRAMIDIPVVGVIEPGARAAVASGAVSVAVIGTDATIKSGAYQRAITMLNPDAEVRCKPCPLFVPLAEEGWVDDDVAELVAKRYLEELRGTGALVLGCTHYPLFRGVIGRVMGPGTLLVDSAVETALEVRRILAANGMLNTGEAQPSREYFVTDKPRKFALVVERFLGRPVENLSKIQLQTEASG